MIRFGTNDESVCPRTLLKLRLTVARFGEMDRAKWWNTKGMLSELGELAVGRGLPKTHLFARARAVFAVAAHRCDEIFNAPNSYTLWRLPAEIEDEAEDAWSKFIESPDEWSAFVRRVSDLSTGSLLEQLQTLELIETDVVDEVKRLRRSDDARAVALQAANGLSMSVLKVLAAAFSRGEVGKLAIPYVQAKGASE